MCADQDSMSGSELGCRCSQGATAGGRRDPRLPFNPFVFPFFFFLFLPNSLALPRLEPKLSVWHCARSLKVEREREVATVASSSSPTSPTGVENEEISKHI